MFLKQLLEDYEFEELLEVYETDKFFMFLRSRYKLTDLERQLFYALKGAEVPFRKHSLEVLALKKVGVLPRVFFVDHEDEATPVKSVNRVSLLEMAGMPVDMVITKDELRSLRFMLVFLLEYTYYKDMDDIERNRKDLKRLGGVEIKVEIE